MRQVLKAGQAVAQRRLVLPDPLVGRDGLEVECIGRIGRAYQLDAAHEAGRRPAAVVVFAALFPLVVSKYFHHEAAVKGVGDEVVQVGEILLRLALNVVLVGVVDPDLSLHEVGLHAEQGQVRGAVLGRAARVVLVPPLGEEVPQVQRRWVFLFFFSSSFPSSHPSGFPEPSWAAGACPGSSSGVLSNRGSAAGDDGGGVGGDGGGSAAFSPAVPTNASANAAQTVEPFISPSYPQFPQPWPARNGRRKRHIRTVVLYRT